MTSKSDTYRKRIYLVAAAVWVVNTLLALLFHHLGMAAASVCMSILFAILWYVVHITPLDDDDDDDDETGGGQTEPCTARECECFWSS